MAKNGIFWENSAPKGLKTVLMNSNDQERDPPLPQDDQNLQQFQNISTPTIIYLMTENSSH